LIRDRVRGKLIDPVNNGRWTLYIESAVLRKQWRIDARSPATAQARHCQSNHNGSSGDAKTAI
jgi:hypothetical protein